MALLKSTGKLAPSVYFSITVREKDLVVAELDFKGVVRFHTSASYHAAQDWIQRTYMEIIKTEELNSSYEDELANNYFGEKI